MPLHRPLFSRIVVHGHSELHLHDKDGLLIRGQANLAATVEHQGIPVKCQMYCASQAAAQNLHR